jgi:hypothetical protein
MGRGSLKGLTITHTQTLLAFVLNSCVFIIAYVLALPRINAKPSKGHWHFSELRLFVSLSGDLVPPSGLAFLTSFQQVYWLSSNHAC